MFALALGLFSHWFQPGRERGALFVVCIPNVNIYIQNNCDVYEDIKQFLTEGKDQANESLWVVTWGGLGQG